MSRPTEVLLFAVALVFTGAYALGEALPYLEQHGVLLLLGAYGTVQCLFYIVVGAFLVLGRNWARQAYIALVPFVELSGVIYFELGATTVASVFVFYMLGLAVLATPRATAFFGVSLVPQLRPA